ncbi:MAG TPA: SDR family NAD(P)-dependent oxidoreductase, partial [Hymenobacter sp.]
TGDLNHGLAFAIERATIDTNVLGFTAVADWAFNWFAAQKSGHLVAISSIGGLRGSREAPAYNASKAYQINYLEGLRQKASRLQLPLFVTDIRPGLVDTAMAKGDGLFWVMPVEKAVQQIFQAIRRRKKVAYVTKRWRLLAAIVKWIPRFVYDKM